MYMQYYCIICSMICPPQADFFNVLWLLELFLVFQNNVFWCLCTPNRQKFPASGRTLFPLKLLDFPLFPLKFLDTPPPQGGYTLIV